MPELTNDEIEALMGEVDEIYGWFGLKPQIKFGTKPAKALGDPAQVGDLVGLALDQRPRLVELPPHRRHHERQQDAVDGADRLQVVADDRTVQPTGQVELLRFLRHLERVVR